MSKTILVVEDNSAFRKYLALALPTLGYRVLTAADGAEALGLAFRHAPDLILLDLRMPVLDGIETLRCIRADSVVGNTPVIVLSGLSDRAKITKAAELGISGFVIKKSVPLAELGDRIDRALASSDLSSSLHGAHSTDQPRAQPPSPQPRHEVNDSAKTQQTASGPLRNTVAVAPRTNPNKQTQFILNNATRLNSAAILTQLQPIITKTDVLARIGNLSDFPPLSPIVTTVMHLTSTPDCTLKQLIDVINLDPTLALRIIKHTNSPLSAARGLVQTVRDAVHRIGVHGVEQVVVSSGIVDRFKSLSADSMISMREFWEHSIACGVIAKMLAEIGGFANCERMFTVGLLHDLGRIALTELLPEQYGVVLKTAEMYGLPTEHVEARMLGLTHTEVVKSLLESWNFPQQFFDPAAGHHFSPKKAMRLSKSSAREALLIGLADRLTHAMLLGESGNDTIYPIEEHCRLLDIRDEAIQSIVSAAQTSIDEARIICLSGTTGSTCSRHADHARSMLASPFRPIYISAEPGRDAIRLFCSQLSTLDASDPNIAVIHIAAGADQTAVIRSLRAAENEAHVYLPLLVLVSDPKCTLKSDLFDNRRYSTLNTPFRVSSFIDSVNSLLRADQTRAAA